MQTVGIKELKNRLTHYLGLVKGGLNIIVTNRGKPVAILHSIDKMEKEQGIEERLAIHAEQGAIRLPMKKSWTPFRPARVKGKPLSQSIVEERR